MGESFHDDYPISGFPSERGESPVPTEGTQPSAAPQSPAPAAPGPQRPTTLVDGLLAGVTDPPPRPGGYVRLRSTAVTSTSARQWLAGLRTYARRGAALLPPLAQRLPALRNRLQPALRNRLQAIATKHTFRPALSMPAIAFLSGITLGGFGMLWMVPARTNGAVTAVESNGVEAARPPITLAGVGETPRLTATAGSQSLAPSPVPVDTVARAAALPQTAPPLQEPVTRRPLEPAARPPQTPSPARRQAAAVRPAAAAGTGYRGSLSVRSRPEGASVFINGRLVGTTPLRLRNEAVGSRAVRVALNGYDPWTGATRVVAGRETALSADLRSLGTP